ncbi:MAG: M23 family metallopeptidase [Clostridia bacterium]|nr:M23 family metallopeptidase [Clostridia bacterium]
MANNNSTYWWPCRTMSLTQRFGGSNNHGGLDIGAYYEKVWSSHRGRVKFVQYWDGHTKTDMQSYGNLVIIEHEPFWSGPIQITLQTYYAHLSEIKVQWGQEVKRGQVIGTSGNSGNSSGPHLHYEIRENGARVNPFKYIDTTTAKLGGNGTEFMDDVDPEKTDTVTPDTTVQTPSISPNATVDTTTVLSNPDKPKPTAAESGGFTYNPGANPNGKVSQEITEIIIKATEGTAKKDGLPYDVEKPAVITEGAEIIINNGKSKFIPVVYDSISLQRPRAGAPATLKFKIVNDGLLTIDCGNAVSFKWNANKMFYGYIFDIKATSLDTLEITAYDQLRYLKNKETYIFKDKTLGDILKKICEDNGLKVGDVEDTNKKVSLGIAEQSGLDWLKDAQDQTVRPGAENKSGSEYVIFDDFGIVRMVEMVPFTAHTNDNKETKIDQIKMLCSGFVDNTEMTGFTWEKSIDDQDEMSTQLKLVYDDKETGKRNVFVYNAEEAQQKYGTLVEYLTGDTWSDETSRKYYVDIWKNKKTDASKKYSAKGVNGAVDCRGGSYIVVQVDPGLASERSCTFMLVEEAKHTFKDGRHTMDLTLRGGAYNV